MENKNNDFLKIQVEVIEILIQFKILSEKKLNINEKQMVEWVRIFFWIESRLNRIRKRGCYSCSLRLRDILSNIT